MTTTHEIPSIPAQRTSPSERTADPRTPTGPVAAALISAGIGSLVLGICVLLGDASPTVKGLLTWSEGVGPLSGKTTVASIAYLVSWPLLHLRLRRRPIDFGPVLTWSFVLVGLGLLLTFPPFYMLFHDTLP